MRDEFSKQTKREAMKRAQSKCEAVYPHLGRCNANLAYGVEFDHELACSNGGDNSLDNCKCLCPTCHHIKTTKIDTPRAAKIVRQRDKHLGIRGPKQTIKQRNTFKKWKSNTVDIRDER